jgi:hypothetical protein
MSRKSKNLTSRTDTKIESSTRRARRRRWPAGEKFNDGDFVIVTWLDRPGHSYAPLMPISEMLESSDTEMMTSIGVIFDKPDFEEVVVIPHVAELGLLPYVGTEFAESRGYGEVTLPYGSVLEIIRLFVEDSRGQPSLEKHVARTR